jgi:hypothetical protein
MAQLTYEQYTRLESAVTRGLRIVIHRRGTEYIVIPLALSSRAGREVIEARNPTTGDAMTLFIDELDSLEPI